MLRGGGGGGGGGDRGAHSCMPHFCNRHTTNMVGIEED